MGVPTTGQGSRSRYADRYRQAKDVRIASTQIAGQAVLRVCTVVSRVLRSRRILFCLSRRKPSNSPDSRLSNNWSISFLELDTIDSLQTIVINLDQLFYDGLRKLLISDPLKSNISSFIRPSTGELILLINFQFYRIKPRRISFQNCKSVSVRDS